MFLIKHCGVKMINLTEVMENRWKLQVNKKVYWLDTLEKLVVYGNEFGIETGEIEEALISFIRNGHNYAEFGEFKKSFIFSKKI